MLKWNMYVINRNTSISPYRAYGCQTVLVSLSKLSYQIKSEGTDNEKGDFNNCRNASDCIHNFTIDTLVSIEDALQAPILNVVHQDLEICV